MQATLEPAELAWLLHMLEAQKVVGVDNAQLFPEEPTTLDALLNRGFAQLQEHGWFTATDSGLNANARLVLMTAVMANPELVLTATHYIAGSRQTITWYIAADLAVEQFLTPDGPYQLAQLESVIALMEHFTAAFSLSEAEPSEWAPLIFDSRTFETILRQARAGDFTALHHALTTNNVPAGLLDSMARTMCQLQPAGKIEGAALQGQKLRAWREIAILRDDIDQSWLARVDEQTNTLELMPASVEQFQRHLQQLLVAVGHVH